MMARSLESYIPYRVLLEKTTRVRAASCAHVNTVVPMILHFTLNHEIVTCYKWMFVGITLAGVVLLRSDQDARSEW